MKIFFWKISGQELAVVKRFVQHRKDESPHEVITNKIHCEIWIFTEQGWKVRYIEDLERGNTYLDGKLYEIS